MSVRTRILVLVCGLTVVAGVMTPARAAFHLMKVREVYVGSPDAPGAQFIELQLASDGQNQVGGHEVFVYSASNIPLATYTFAGSVANPANNASILLATAAAQSYFNVTPDLTMATASIPASGGKVCFESPGFDCVSWGTYPSSTPSAGSGDSTGTPFNASEGLVSGTSIDRAFNGTSMTDTGDSAADFSMVAPTPRNNAGVTGVVPSTTGLDAAMYTTSEAAGSVTVTVTRTPATSAMTVDYSTLNGTATSGSDFTSTAGTMSFVVGDSSESFVVPITSDSMNEPEESFTVMLRNPSLGVMNRANAAATITGELPGPPRFLMASAAATSISLSWMAPTSSGSSALTGYKIYVGTSPGPGKSLLATVATSPTTYTHSGLPSGTTRYYQVGATNSLGEGALSNEASATTGTPSTDQMPNATISGGSPQVVLPGGTVSGNATDDYGLTKVELWIWNLQVNAVVKIILASCTCSGTSSSWTATLPVADITLPPGAYVMKARAYDNKQPTNQFNNSSNTTLIYI